MLHGLLLALPWADVFTTNYDTLLERTEVDGRTYQLVSRSTELTTAFAPRIVKLHGSFPSQTPFIITDEDYRTYPRRFAPFVNSVQQSLLENSFVLPGFSGEDPNFLEWTGWIRDELGGNHASIYLVGILSLGNLEGWCTYLIGAVDQSFDITRFTEIRDEFWERWEDLKAWDCSPWPYVEYFEGALSAPVLFRKQVEEVRGFDPNEVSETWHLSQSIDRYLPAFAYLRLFERVGIPMRLPMVNIVGEQLKNACFSVAPFTRLLIPALLIRSGKPHELTRTEVAQMNHVAAKRLHTWCTQCLARGIGVARRAATWGISQRSLLGPCTEVLSRLAFRLDTADLRNSFQLVLDLHRLPASRAQSEVHEACMNWFKRLFHAADNELLVAWLPDLIREPLLDDQLDPVRQQPGGWPEPLARFPFDRARGTQINGALVSKVEDATSWLLQRAASESGRRRQWAIFRLTGICLAKWMTVDQQRQLGDLLWADRAQNGLPDIPGLSIPALLDLPTSPQLDVTSLIKGYILSRVPNNVISRPAGGRVIATLWVGRSFFSEVSDVSKPPVIAGNKPKNGIDWSRDEAKQLFQKALAWWANDKAAFDIKNSSLDLNNSVNRELGRLGLFLIRAVLPRLEPADEGEWQNLLNLLREVQEIGGFASEVFPYLLLHQPTDVEDIAEKVASGLDSEIESAVAASARAVRNWIHLSTERGVPEPPPRLLAALVERVVFRQSPGLAHCLTELAFLIGAKPAAIDDSQAMLLTASLIPWQRATALENMASEFIEADRPDLQVRVAMLAGALAARHIKLATGMPEPRALALWRNLCESSPLPEVRRAFRSVEDINWCESDPDRNQATAC